MTASEYKNYKGIRKENLRDNMTDIEVILTDLGEVAKVAKNNLENKLNKSVISTSNNLKYKYDNKFE